MFYNGLCSEPKKEHINRLSIDMIKYGKREVAIYKNICLHP